MPTPFSRHSRLKACGLALLLTGAAGFAAEAPSVPKGSTREQMLRHLGEPRSQIVVGDRVVVFYAKERYVLRNDVIVDFEPISSEPVRRPPPAPVAAPAAVEPVALAATVAEAREPAPAPTPAAVRRGAEPAPTSAQGTAPGAVRAAQPAAPSGVASPLVQRPAPAQAEPAPVAAATTAEPRLEIKRVLPRGAAGSSTPAASVATPPAAVPASAPTVAGNERPSSPPNPAKASETKPSPTPPAPASAPAAGGPPATLPSLDASPSLPTAAVDEPEVDPAKAAASAAAAAEKKAKVRNAVQRRIEAIGDAPPPDPTTAIWSAKNFAIAVVIMAGGIGYMVWRRRQHQLVMAATAVSHAPFETPAVNDVASGAVFSGEIVAKLDSRRFEDLVVAYYCKTGVVAVRANEAPESPVHIKISWKGEKRPFACVHCIAQPTGLVDAKPLQQLFDVINAEGIRRGYVVTTGKFNVSARDFAEEKHLTILHGDLFIEKLNALPGPARNEIMQAITGSTPAPAAPAA